MWIEDSGAASDQAGLLAKVAQRLNQRIGSDSAPLVKAVDRTATQVTLEQTSIDTMLDTGQIADLANDVPGLRIAFGAPESGVAGFRSSLAQAEHVSSIARISTTAQSRVVSYSDDGMPVIALLAEHTETARRWVFATLGSLALDNEQAEL